MKIDRPGLMEALRFARAGDCIEIWKLDRLGRSIQGLITPATDLSVRKIDYRSLTDGFDTSPLFRPIAIPYPDLGRGDGARVGEGANDCRAGGSAQEGQYR